MRSSLLQNAELSTEPGSFALQNGRMLKVDLAGTGGFFYAKQGSMVAYQGEVDFNHQGSGGVAKMFKKAFTGEGMSLMKVSGSGDVFLAQEADEIFIVHLEGESVTVSGSATSSRSRAPWTWDINRVEGASMLSGGLFNTTFTGTGALAVTASPGPRWSCRSTCRPTSTCRRRCSWSTSLRVDGAQDRQARRRHRPRVRRGLSALG